MKNNPMVTRVPTVSAVATVSTALKTESGHGHLFAHIFSAL
jgi:hypothetical protein